MKKSIFVCILSMFVLSGCAAIKSPIDEGYKFGDLTKSTLGPAIEAQAKYCSETDPVKRALMLTAIKSVVPEFPASGACTELHSLIGENTVEDIAKDVDFEQAIKDQKKFQSK